MENLVNIMLHKKKWAVMGASDNVDKFGYKVYKKLKDKGYEVYGVNPNCNEIEGEKCYDSIDSLPEKVECVSIIVNPKITNKSLEEIKDMNIKHIWAQPGAFNEETKKIAKELELNFVYDKCVLVELA
ncbi:MAG: CoA-binding protein [Anaeromicrobium sp.]|uniref:CoA-binding protein n=1 Tax=Anaeromicrobium sp. TaxID=1929132 RepID=UPI0025D10EB8|nr:CoA-binding protein [Anaeromicrobium sp.]MCT4593379.1 CoA-binding protein [Anaeromicrobium sp.]